MLKKDKEVYKIISHLDDTPNELRYRVQNPDKFGLFRRKQIDEGVSLVIACPKDKGVKKCRVGMQTQSVRFDRSKFIASQAAEWLLKHEDKIKRLK